MKVQWGINHIQNLKEFGKQEPKELFEVELKPDSDGDYRFQAVKWTAMILEKQDKVPFELFTTDGKTKSWTPIFASDFKQPSNFSYEDSDLPKFICELLNDEVREYVG